MQIVFGFGSKLETLPDKPWFHPGIGLFDVDNKSWPTLGQERPWHHRAWRHAVDNGQVFFGDLGLHSLGLQSGQVHLGMFDRHMAVEVGPSHRPLAHWAPEQNLRGKTKHILNLGNF